jgi:hypothetical protein
VLAVYVRHYHYQRQLVPNLFVLFEYPTMSGPLVQVQELLLAFYASQGRYPRPNAVTRSEIDEIQRLAVPVARVLMVMMNPQSAGQNGNDGGLRETIRQQDQQVDIYEDAELLVSLNSSGW